MFYVYLNKCGIYCILYTVVHKVMDSVTVNPLMESIRQVDVFLMCVDTTLNRYMHAISFTHKSTKVLHVHTRKITHMYITKHSPLGCTVKYTRSHRLFVSHIVL